MQLLVCQTVRRNIFGVTTCGYITISCGSIVAEFDVEVEEDTQNTTSSVPKNIYEFEQQARNIINDTMNISRFHSSLHRSSAF